MKFDREIQRSFDGLGLEPAKVRWLKAEYNMRCTRVGDMIRMEQGDLSAEMAQDLPLSTELGQDALLAFLDLVNWVGLQLQLNPKTVS